MPDTSEHDEMDAYGKSNQMTVVFAPWHPSMNLRTFLGWLVKLPVIGLAVDYVVPRRKLLVDRVHRDNLIGVHLPYGDGNEWEIIKEVQAGEVWLGQIVTNNWKNKFWMRGKDGKIEMGCICYDKDGFVSHNLDNAYRYA